MAGEGEQQQDEVWRKDTFPRVLALVSTRLRLSLRDVYSLLLVSPSCYRSLLSHPTPWQDELDVGVSKSEQSTSDRPPEILWEVVAHIHTEGLTQASDNLS